MRKGEMISLVCRRNNAANGRKGLATVRCRRVRKKSKIGGEGTAGLSKRQPEVEWFEQGGGELTGERRTTQDAAPFFVESQSQSGLGPCEAHKCAGHTRLRVSASTAHSIIGTQARVGTDMVTDRQDSTTHSPSRLRPSAGSLGSRVCVGF